MARRSDLHWQAVTPSIFLLRARSNIRRKNVTAKRHNSSRRTDVDVRLHRKLISEQRARDLRPSTMVVLPWYFKKEIVDREQDYLRQGGKLLFPMPYAHVVTKDREINL